MIRESEESKENTQGEANKPAETNGKGEANKPAEKGKSEKILHLTEAELLNVVKKLQKEKPVTATKTNSLLEQILDESRSGSGAPVGTRLLTEEEIDVEDYLDEPIIFFSYSFSFTIMDDRRFGQPTKTPYGTPIRFRPLYRYIKPGASRFDQEIVSQSCAVIKSKRERDWIRNHSLFGIRIFETLKGAQQVDRQFADILVETSNMLNSMTQFEIIERAKQEKMQITPDIDDVKKRLTYVIAEKEMKKPKRQAVKPVDSAWTPDRTGEVLVNEDEVGKEEMEMKPA